MKILLVHGSLTEKASLDILKNHQDDALLVFEADSLLPSNAYQKDIIFRQYEDYVTLDDCKMIDKTALEMSMAWGKHEIFEFPSGGKLLVPKLLRRSVFENLLTLIRNLECATRILETENISVVYLGDGVDIFRPIWKEVAKRFGVRCVDLYVQHQIVNPPKFSRKKQLLNSIKKLKLILKKNIILTLKIIPTTKWVFILATYLLDQYDAFWVWVNRKAGRKIVLDTDRDHYPTSAWHMQIWRDPNLYTLYQVRTVHNWLSHIIYRKFDNYVQNLKSLFTEFADSKGFEYREIDLSQYLQENIEHWLQNTRISLALGDALSRRLRIIKPDAVICGWWLHESEFAFSQISQSLNIPVIMFLPTYDPGSNWVGAGIANLLNVSPDIACVWGASSAAVHNLPIVQAEYPTKTIQIGAPLSFYTKIEKMRQLQLVPHTDILTSYFPEKIGSQKVVLLTTQYFENLSAFYTPLRFRKMVDIFIEAARNYPDILFVVKVHPNSSDNTRVFYDSQILNSGYLSNLKILQLNTNIEVILPFTSILVSMYSTTLLEATLLNIPTIQLDPSSYSISHPDIVDLGCALSARNSLDLCNHIWSILNDSNIQNMMEIGRKKFISYSLSSTIFQEDISKKIINSDS
jgi:hypothetical protein